jgi:predicted S18 family serine protease
MKRFATVLVSTALILASIAPAVADASGGSTCSTYNPQNCTTPTTTTTTTTTLPFTGLDIALLVVGGIVLVGAGLLVRTASRRVGS